MQRTRMFLMALAPLVVLGACTSLSDQDRSLLTTASQNAEAAKLQSAQALQAAQAAQTSAAAAAADAKAANEKADRIFQRSLRK